MICCCGRHLVGSRSCPITMAVDIRTQVGVALGDEVDTLVGRIADESGRVVRRDVRMLRAAGWDRRSPLGRSGGSVRLSRMPSIWCLTSSSMLRRMVSRSRRAASKPARMACWISAGVGRRWARDCLADAVGVRGVAGRRSRRGQRACRGGCALAGVQLYDRCRESLVELIVRAGLGLADVPVEFVAAGRCVRALDAEELLVDV